MEWLSEGKAGGGRAYVLLGVLVLTALWALSTTRKQGSAPAGGSAPPVTPVVTLIAEPVSDKSTTPEGWGRDPFDPSRRPFEASNARR